MVGLNESAAVLYRVGVIGGGLLKSELLVHRRGVRVFSLALCVGSANATE